MAKELSSEEMARQIYTAWRELYVVAGEVTPWPAYFELSEELQAIEVAQVQAVIDNLRLRPYQLHEHFKVAAQQAIAQGGIDEIFIEEMNKYMIPFNNLDIIHKTKFRLQVQLARILNRHTTHAQRLNQRQR